MLNDLENERAKVLSKMKKNVAMLGGGSFDNNDSTLATQPSSIKPVSIRPVSDLEEAKGILNLVAGLLGGGNDNFPIEDIGVYGNKSELENEESNLSLLADSGMSEFTRLTDVNANRKSLESALIDQNRKLILNLITWVNVSIK